MSDAPASSERKSRRGPAPLPAAEKRAHCVSVRLNADELAKLDAQRGRFQRGEWLRMAALDELPPTIPAVNVDAWRDLARVAANLNQLARAANVAGLAPESWGQAAAELQEFRRLLIGAGRGRL